MSTPKDLHQIKETIILRIVYTVSAHMKQESLICEGKNRGQGGGKVQWGAWKGGKNGTIITPGTARTL